MTSKSSNNSDINQSFKDKSVLITGATGLLGKFIAFKILLSIEKIKYVYIMIRDKENDKYEDRFENLINKSRDLFKYLDKDTLKKLIPIKGDISLEGLGLSATDRSTLINDVSFVFHSAANIKFEAQLKGQILTNVGGTKKVIELCKELKNFCAFVHISTAYSNPGQIITEEKIYKSHRNPVDILETARNTELIMTYEEYLGDFPNSYTYTKNLGENLVNLEMKNSEYPTAIVRPGYVIPAYREPIPGWIEKIDGVTGVIFLKLIGLLRVFKADLDDKLVITPVDIVANTCIAAAWNASNKHHSEIMVYNCVPAAKSVPSHRQFSKYIHELGSKFPSTIAIRPIGTPMKEFWKLPIVFRLTQIFSEICFAYFYDFVLLCIGKKPILVNRIKYTHKFFHAVRCIVEIKFNLTNDNFVQLNEDLIGVDKDIFNCDVRGIDWFEFVKSGYFFIRKTILKEKNEDIDKGILRMKM